MTVAVIIRVVALICLSATSFLVAVTFRKALSDAFRALESSQARADRRLEQSMDRLMTIKWEDYAVVRSTNDDEGGGFFPPGSDDDDEDGAVTVEDGKWGHLSTIRERMQATNDEQALLDEDFDETDSPRRF